ncbi:MAG: DNA polymerase I [Lewinellaceae bacterium]|nr:DNA polymerase I [Lewinellaceae bacterium]HRW75094.1 DNA polymerase I [Saprospiraceae bacterium]
MADKKLFLLDGHALVYRAHFSFIARPLINSKGWNTSAVTGFVNTLWDIMQNEKPTHLAVSFDLSGPTFRHVMYPEYKAQREEQPEDISFALPWIRDIIRAWHIPVVELEGYEADDVIGTLAKQAEKEGFTVYMVTPDKDYGQLVSDKVFMYKPSRQGNGVEILGEKEICEIWNIQHVDQVVDMLGLQGDSVDNIPGVPGIGPKTAAKLLEEFGSVENLLENADQVKGKNGERLVEFRDQAILSKTLARIDTQAPITFDATDFNLDPPDRKKLSELFRELEFRSLANKILGEEQVQSGHQGDLFGGEVTVSDPVQAPAAHSVATSNIHSVGHTYHLADTPAKRKDLINKLNAVKQICFDTETTDVDAMLAEIVGMSFAIEPHEAWYVPVPADQEDAKKLVAEFKPIFENPGIAKIGQNIKYDAEILKWYDINLQGEYLDTMVAHYLLEPDLRHGMDYLAETYLKYQPVSITSLIGKKGVRQLSMRDVEVEKVAEYAAEDADITLQLYHYLWPRIQSENLENLYNTMEGPLIRVLTEMEFNGIRLDSDFLAAYSIELDKEIQETERTVYKMAGSAFNMSSPKQVGEILFDRMKIPYRWSKTKSGQYSTDEEKLTELAPDNPIVDQILRYRGLTKLKSTYVDALPKMVNPRTGRIHSSFNQTIAATGRLSSNNPNLQNIPIRTEEGRKVREAFIPRDEDHLLLAADYSQIELRLIAHISDDQAMLAAFQAGHDIHSATAANVYGVPLEEVTSDQRRNAKTVNFSIIYGAGATNLSRQLNISRKEASELIEAYFAQFQGLKNYMEQTVEFAREKGYVETLLGRRRFLRDINSKSGLERSNAERMAINTPIQGTAADMIKVAMIRIQEALEAGNFRTKMILQVHDELVFDVYKPELDKVSPLIEDLMKHAIPNLKVPILVGMGTGTNWLEAH